MPAALAALVAMPFGLEALPLWVMGLGHRGDGVGARGASPSVPGAVLRVPAMPSAAFVLMIAGGLWLMLWQTRWRLAGIALIAGGAALAPTLRAPDISSGATPSSSPCAGRTASSPRVGATRASFELERWLEHDGDAPQPARRRPRRRLSPATAIGCRATRQGA